MSWLSFSDFWHSLLSASIYGCIFSFFYNLLKDSKYLINLLFSAFLSMFFYNGTPFKYNYALLKIDESRKEEKLSGEIFSAVSVILYSIGIILLSYYTLDGEMRAFIIISSVISLAVFNSFVTPLVFKPFFTLIRNLLCIMALVFRTLFYPIKAIVTAISRKYSKTQHFAGLFRRFSPNLTLDIVER